MPEHRTRAQRRVEEIDISPTKLLGDIETLKGELDEARKGSDEYLTALQRERAEFQNFRRRTTEERERDAGLAGEDLLRKVLTRRRRLRPRDRGSARTRSPRTPGSRASPRSIASSACCSSRRASAPSTRPGVGRSIRANTTRSPRCPGPVWRKARSSRRSGAAIGSGTASFDRPSWRSPARPMDPTTSTGHDGGGTDGPAPINGHAPH